MDQNKLVADPAKGVDEVHGTEPKGSEACDEDWCCAYAVAQTFERVAPVGCSRVGELDCLAASVLGENCSGGAIWGGSEQLRAASGYAIMGAAPAAQAPP